MKNLEIKFTELVARHLQNIIQTMNNNSNGENNAVSIESKNTKVLCKGSMVAKSISLTPGTKLMLNNGNNKIEKVTFKGKDIATSLESFVNSYIIIKAEESYVEIKLEEYPNLFEIDSYLQ